MPSLLSILIPAYNNSELLARCFKSILLQTYRPIEIIISDDCSPNDLSEVVLELKALIDAQITLRFFRQSVNLGTQDNFIFCLYSSSGEYLIPFSHDNVFTDHQFIERAVRWLALRKNASIYFANSIDERSGQPMLQFDQCDQFKDRSAQFICSGEEFISSFGLKSWGSHYLGWSQFSVIKRSFSDRTEAFELPFCVDRSLATRLDLLPDNVDAFKTVLALNNDVVFDKGVVGLAGGPAGSYSTASKWSVVCNEVNFLVYRAVLSRFKNSISLASKKAIEAYLTRCTVSRFNIKLMRHFGLSIEGYLYLSKAIKDVVFSRVRRSVRIHLTIIIGPRLTERIRRLINRNRH
jgi:glycosyltransferase involved in cell wall biosynthesis